MNRKRIRCAGACFFLDSLLTLFLGRKYVGLFLFGRREYLYSSIIEWLLDLPVWQLRGTGAAEASLGVAVLSKSPLDVSSFYRLVAPGYAAIDPGW